MQSNKLKQFREELYQNFTKRNDSKLELLDALSSQTRARSPVELSLASCFRREHGSVYAAINTLSLDNKLIQKVTAKQLPEKSGRFHQLVVDVTACPRPEAYCLADRGNVYAGPRRGVVRGHQYSLTSYLPEVPTHERTWAVTLAVDRVKSEQDKELLGAKQIKALLGAKELPFGQELTVVAGDTYYSKPAFLHALAAEESLVTMARVRADRIFYRQPTGDDKRLKYGSRLIIKDDSSWGRPDASWSTQVKRQRRHAIHFVEVQAWHNMLMRGKRKPYPMRMYKYPFTLVRVVVTKERGKPVYKRPLWLLVMGKRRGELTLSDIYQAYNDRFRQEHLFRFLKQRLLLTRFQTTSAEREEQWWRFVILAYLQLWVARPFAQTLPNPWERYKPASRARARSPSFVQRDLARLLAILGTISSPAKRRGIPNGRPFGYRLPPKPHRPVRSKRPKKQSKRS